ncbi:uncharacterized protein LOC121880298 [Homarus americanus]|uniref:uncharacterized protein LOC121880298 n=1 Tax=Homarus americanus TaxID=6706 RepID=UPI001C459F1B|nr:uncharacterized protein LOC121880298 [Homarus americanus]
MWMAKEDTEIISNQARFDQGSSGLSLSLFNLEPLRDSLVHFSLSHNAISAFPEQFSRSFTRLAILDLSFNNISDVLVGGFRDMPRLQHLDLSNNLLHSFTPRTFTTPLLYLNLAGNPWNCTCDSQWILKIVHHNASITATSGTITINTPTCSSPLHLRHRELISLTESEICLSKVSATDSQVVYVGDDVDGLLKESFASLHLLNVTALNHQTLIISWRVDAEFYSLSKPSFEPLSWAVTLRETREDPRMAAATRIKLEKYKEERHGRRPSDSLFTDMLHGLEPETQYTLCLTPVQGQHLFTRPDNCRQATTLAKIFFTTTTATTTEAPRMVPFVTTENYSVKTERVSLVQESRRVNLSWNVTVSYHRKSNTPVILLHPLGWKISYRRFGEENDMEVILVSRGGEPVQNFTNHYFIEGLEPGTGYTVCFRPMSNQEVSESLASNTSGLGDVIPQAQSQVSRNSEFFIETTRGRSIQSHIEYQFVDTYVNKGLPSSLPDNSEIHTRKPSKKNFQSKSSTLQSQGNNSTFSSQGNNTTFSSQGNNLTFSSQGNNTTFSSQENNLTFSSQGNNPTFSSQGSNLTFLSEDAGRSPPRNIPQIPNFPSSGSFVPISSNITPAPRLQTSPNPLRTRSGGNFVYTSTGERIALPATSSGSVSPFSLPSIVGPSVNIGSRSPPISSPLPINSRQRFIYEFDEKKNENLFQQTFPYDLTTEAPSTTTQRRQLHTYEIKSKRSITEDFDTRYEKTLESEIIQYCQEIVTANENDIIAPVAIASVASSLSTMLLVIIFCWCCPKKCRHRKSERGDNTQKINTISAPTPVSLYSGHNSIITGSVIGKSDGDLKSTSSSRTMYLDCGGNSNPGKTVRSVSITSSSGYLTPLQIPNGVANDPGQMLRNDQIKYLASMNDRLPHQHKDLQDFHPGYDIPPTSYHKSLYGYDYPHPTPVNPIGTHNSQCDKPETLNELKISSQENSVANYNYRESRTMHPEMNLNIPFDHNKSSDLSKSIDLNKSLESNNSLDHNYVSPKDLGNKPRTYIKNAPTNFRHRKFSFPQQVTIEQLSSDTSSSSQSQEYSHHPLSVPRLLSNSAPDLANVEEIPTSLQDAQVSEKTASARLSYHISNEKNNSLPRLSKEESNEVKSLPPIHPLPPKSLSKSKTPTKPNEMNGYTNLHPSDGDPSQQRNARSKKDGDVYSTWTSTHPSHTRGLSSLGEVVLTGGTLIEVPEGYVVPNPPKPARSLRLLVQSQQRVENSEMHKKETPETVSSLAPQGNPPRRLAPLVIPNDTKGEKSQITHIITPEIDSNRLVIRTGMPV